MTTARKQLERQLAENHEELLRRAVISPGLRSHVKLEGPALYAANYNTAFPTRPPLAYGNGMVVGTWMIGACYKNPNKLYGAYPNGYLERVHAMFPDACSVLHVFSGGMDYMYAWRAYASGNPTCEPGKAVIELVDMHGPEQGRHPTWQGNILDYCALKPGLCSFDLILADPPYSAADAKKYDCPPPNRREIMRNLRRVAHKGTNLVWLDQVWPMHRKAEWKTWGTIGLVRSTNHRVRLVSMFEAV